MKLLELCSSVGLQVEFSPSDTAERLTLSILSMAIGMASNFDCSSYYICATKSHIFEDHCFIFMFENSFLIEFDGLNLEEQTVIDSS